MNALCYALVVLALTSAAGCGRAPQAATGDSAAAGKLAARVNGAEITLEAGGAAAGGPGADPREALEKIIDRELLVQKALEAGLDRDARVKRALESARRQVLAKAYLERAAASASSTPEEIADFYARNPALFAERRIYRLREMTVAGAADKLDLVKSEVATAKSLDEAADWLKWRNFRVSAVTGATQPAEQLPLAYLPQLMRLKEGGIAVVATALGASVVQLVHAQDAPLTEEEAAPLIEEFLSGRKRLQVAAAEVKRLRSGASIEYMGDFQRKQN
jgi:EpsD family peptidyl-prolyl cis-trans isomerase